MSGFDPNRPAPVEEIRAENEHRKQEGAPDWLDAAEIPGPYSIGSDVWPGLAKATEEAAELIQVAGKIIAAGGADGHWDGSNLRTRLAGEVADLYAALDFLAAQNGLMDAFTHERRGHKLALFTDWHSHNRDGSLNRDDAPVGR